MSKVAYPLLSVEQLTTCFEGPRGRTTAVDQLSFEIHRGETFALLGESGCGKSVTSLSLMRLVPEPAGRIIAGRVCLHGQDLLSLPEVAMRRVRGRRMAMIFQEPMTSLNPVLTIGDQIAEGVRVHQGLRGRAAFERVLELLDAVGIPDAGRRYVEYPHQLSGGMKQRVMIAIALSGEPDLLIADEPTTALDVTIQAQVLALLRDLQQKTGMAILLITHDLGVVSEMADRVGVMYAGQLIEQASREAFFSGAAHPYSRKLFESLPNMDKRDEPLTVIRGSVPTLTETFQGCRFAPRCDFSWAHCHEAIPDWTEVGPAQRARCHLLELRFSAREVPVYNTAPAVSPGRHYAKGQLLLQVDDLKVHFPIHKGLFQRTVGHVFAVDGVSMQLQRGKTLALVGESGCGKTTMGKSILQLIRPTSGSVQFEGHELTQLHGDALRRLRSAFQIIFQDPFASMNPRMRVNEIVEEGMISLGLEGNAPRRRARVRALLSEVGLPADAGARYPHEFSGGQRQRICIARALAVAPRLLVCDEPTSALDVSVQAQILNLLRQLQSSFGISYLFITHNLAVVSYLADEVAVMYLGKIVEQGTTAEVLQHAKHPYTCALLSAIPVLNKDARRAVIRLQGDLPSPSDPPRGCHFHTRCPEVMPRCREDYPAVTAFSDTHRARCFLFDNRD